MNGRSSSGLPGGTNPTDVADAFNTCPKSSPVDIDFDGPEGCVPILSLLKISRNFILSNVTNGAYHSSAYALDSSISKFLSPSLYVQYQRSRSLLFV